MADQVSSVVNNTANWRFELRENGHLAFASYREAPGGVLLIPHVEAAEELRGTGTAGRLMEGMVAYARAHNLKLTPICPYAVAWFRRNPAMSDVLS